MGSTGVYEDKKTGRKIHFSHQAETRHIIQTLVGKFQYADGKASCEGAPGTMGTWKLEGMLVTEGLAIRADKVTVRENFKTGSVEILELGITIRVLKWRKEGLRTEFGIIARKPRKIPCPWRKV